jgi:hypothetical protein
LFSKAKERTIADCWDKMEIPIDLLVVIGCGADRSSASWVVGGPGGELSEERQRSWVVAKSQRFHIDLLVVMGCGGGYG